MSTARGPEMYLPLWLRTWGAPGTGLFNIKIIQQGCAEHGPAQPICHRPLISDFAKDAAYASLQMDGRAGRR